MKITMPWEDYELRDTDMFGERRDLPKSRCDLQFNVLKAMHNYIIAMHGNDSGVMEWWNKNVPLSPTDEELMKIASDLAWFTDTTRMYASIVRWNNHGGFEELEDDYWDSLIEYKDMDYTEFWEICDKLKG